MSDINGVRIIGIYGFCKGIKRPSSAMKWQDIAIGEELRIEKMYSWKVGALWAHHAVQHSIYCGLCAVRGARLGQYVAHMVNDSVRADDQLIGYFLVGIAKNNET